MSNEYNRFTEEVLKYEQIFQESNNRIRSFEIFIPESYNVEENVFKKFLDNNKLPYDTWMLQHPALVKRTNMDELTKFFALLQELNLQTRIDKSIDIYVTEKDNWINMFESLLQVHLGTLIVHRNSKILGVSYDLFVTSNRKNLKTIQYDCFIADREIIRMPDEYWFKKCQDTETKFWPTANIKIFCIPSVNYDFLTTKDIRPGSAVVDLSNFKYWKLFYAQEYFKGFDIYDNKEFMLINMSHLGNMPKICPCNTPRDKDGYFRIYFVNIDPVVLKGFLDFYSVDNTLNGNKGRIFGISTDVYSLMAIINPDIISNGMNWNNEMNEKILLQYILLALLVNAEYFLKIIHKNVLTKLGKDQITRLKHYLTSTYVELTSEQLQKTGLL